MVKALPNPTSVERNDKNIRDNWGRVNNILQKVSGKLREFCPEMAVATLLAYLREFCLEKKWQSL